MWMAGCVGATLEVCLVGGEHTDVLLLTLIGDFGEKLVSDLG